MASFLLGLTGIIGLLAYCRLECAIALDHGPRAARRKQPLHPLSRKRSSLGNRPGVAALGRFDPAPAICDWYSADDENDEFHQISRLLTWANGKVSKGYCLFLLVEYKQLAFFRFGD